jgi:hypothetical protein
MPEGARALGEKIVERPGICWPPAWFKPVEVDGFASAVIPQLLGNASGATAAERPSDVDRIRRRQLRLPEILRLVGGPVALKRKRRARSDERTQGKLIPLSVREWW